MLSLLWSHVPLNPGRRRGNAVRRAAHHLSPFKIGRGLVLRFSNNARVFGGRWFRLMVAPHEQFFWTSRQWRVMLLRRAISLSSGGDYDTDPKALPLL